MPATAHIVVARKARSYANTEPATPATAHIMVARKARSYNDSGRMYGNNNTSRIDAESVSSITNRSMPMPRPPVGGRPTSSARM